MLPRLTAAPAAILPVLQLNTSRYLSPILLSVICALLEALWSYSLSGSPKAERLDSTHLLFPHFPGSSHSTKRCKRSSKTPVMTSNIWLEQEIMNPIWKHQIGLEKWLQRKNCTFVTTVLVRRISISKFFINRIIPSVYSYASVGLTNFFQYLCMGKGTGLYQDAHTSSREFIYFI